MYEMNINMLFSFCARQTRKRLQPMLLKVIGYQLMLQAEVLL